MSDILVYINAHLSLNNSNRAVVLAAHPTGARFLYPANNGKETPQKVAQGQLMYRQFREVDDTVLNEFAKVLEEPLDASKAKGSAISGALSLALAYINRSKEKEDAEVSSYGRILLLSVSGELASQYVPTMNAIFAAQRMHIPIDVCQLAGETVFLQQASDSTNGVYIQIKHPKGLIQYLMSAFITDSGLRPHLNLPTQRDVDFRAACFLTNKIVEIGYVCSVCLCIISQVPTTEECPMCGTKYEAASLAALKRVPVVGVKKKKKKKKVDGTPTATSTPTATPTPGNGTS